MSLFGALQIGRSSLAAQQVGLQVTGNNISNAGTAGYTRETVDMTASDPTELQPGVFLGTGVSTGAVNRAVSESLNASVNSATSDQNAADTLNTALGQLQSTFGALGDNDLSAAATSFFNGFSTLATNPQDTGQQAVVVQNGVALASQIQSLRQQISTQRDNTNTELTGDVSQANSLLQTIASLNSQISTSESGLGGNNTLEDQRDQAVNQLSQLMNVRTIDQGNGTINVLTGSTPLVEGTTARPIGTQILSTNGASTTNVVFTDNGDPLNITSGSIGGLIDTRDNQLTPAIQTLDTFASGLIQVVNSISSQGQGSTNFSSVTGTTAVSNVNAALNAGPITTGLPSTPVNGTFTITETDATGNTTSRQIAVNLSGTGTPDTLTTLAAKISDSNLTASVTNGQLTIQANTPGTTFSFSDDTSGALAALGVNTYFTGSDASNIAVNQTLVNDPSKLATGKGNVPGSNQNALALALGYSATSNALGGQSLNSFYTGYIGNLASVAKTASDNDTAQQSITTSLTAQQQAYSGVDLNEEAINLTEYQRAFQGSAEFITTVNSLMDSLLTMVST